MLEVDESKRIDEDLQNWNSHALLVAMENSAATLENVLPFPQNLNMNNVTVWNSIARYILKILKYPQKIAHENDVCSGFVIFLWQTFIMLRQISAFISSSMATFWTVFFFFFLNRTVFWERVRVGWFGRMALKHV